MSMRSNNILVYSSIVMMLIFQAPGMTNLLADIRLDTTDESGSKPITASASSSSVSLSSSSAENDIFGIKKIYPTKSGGREWFMDMNDPRSDGIFFITSDRNITRQEDGSWRVNNTNVRLNVDTLANMVPWRDVEIT